MSTNICIYALQKMLFDREEINTSCFTNGKYLFSNGLHGNYIICTVECTFHLIIDVQRRKHSTYYLQIYSYFCGFSFSSFHETMTNLHVSKTEISGERDRILRYRERFSYLFRNYNLLR